MTFFALLHIRKAKDYIALFVKMAMITFVFPILIALASYFSGNFCIQCKPRLLQHARQMFSCTAGIALSYIILILLPKLYHTPSAAAYILFGFTFFLFLHTSLNTRKLQRIHAYFSLLYHILVGIVLQTTTASNFYEGFLLFIPMLLMTGASKLSAHHVHHLGPYTTNKSTWAFILSIVPVLGSGIAFLFSMPSVLLTVLIGIVGGILVFTVMREFIPTAKDISIAWFLVGEAAFVVVSLL